MAALYCLCEQKTPIWGEAWWGGGRYNWAFFDDRQTSETYTEQLTHCPACGQQLDRKNLQAVSYRAWPAFS